MERGHGTRRGSSGYEPLILGTCVLITYSDVEHLLETYSLEEILELNELTDADVLFLLLKHNLVEIPNPRPLDVR